MLGASEARQIGADFGDYLECRGGVDPVDAGQVDAAHPQQRGAQVELRSVFARAVASLARFWPSLRHSRSSWAPLAGRIRPARGIGIIQRYRLRQGEQVLLAPIALQRLGDLFLAGPMRPCLSLASTCPSRSPARIARMTSGPSPRPHRRSPGPAEGSSAPAPSACAGRAAPGSSQQHRPLAAALRSAQISSFGRKAPASNPKLINCCSHWQSSTSDLRPETFLTCRALTR